MTSLAFFVTRDEGLVVGTTLATGLEFNLDLPEVGGADDFGNFLDRGLGRGGKAAGPGRRERLGKIIARIRPGRFSDNRGHSFVSRTGLGEFPRHQEIPTRKIG
jgi:hypothetical protein